MKPYPIHPLAAALPGPTEEEFEALKHSIERQGLLHPIVLYKGEILDGRNRYYACNEVGAELRFEELKGDLTQEALFHYVIAANLCRRHLTASQKAAYGVQLVDGLEKDAKRRQRSGAKLPEGSTRGRARDIAARQIGVSARYIEAARGIREKNSQLFQEILAGKVTLQEARAMLRGAEDHQAPAKPQAVRLPLEDLPETASQLLVVWGNEDLLEMLKERADFYGLSLSRLGRQNGKWSRI